MRRVVLVEPVLTECHCGVAQIGVCVMVHGDDKGLVLPPRVAPIQVLCVNGTVLPLSFTRLR